MKKNTVILSLSNFLIPLTLLYGLFFLTNYFEEGIFAAVSTSIIFFVGYFIYIKNINQISLTKKISNAISLLTPALLIFYILLLFSLITNYLSL
ncbi:MAG: hypothetical protein KGQ36_01730 [Rickettsiales bacterium]|nr:hypothetical protein [Rickettsiales bacterium]